MRLKKDPNKDLNLKRGLYFAIGLLLTLVLIYIALEWKTADDSGGYDLGYETSIGVNLTKNNTSLNPSFLGGKLL